MLELIKIGNRKIKGNLEYCFDGCHKIYLMSVDKDREEKKDMIDNKNWVEEDFNKIIGTNLEECYINTCSLRFIDYIDFKADKQYQSIIRQCATRATFVYKDTITNETVKHIVDNYTGNVKVVRG